jgi:hypothetical protein
VAWTTDSISTARSRQPWRTSRFGRLLPEATPYLGTFLPFKRDARNVSSCMEQTCGVCLSSIESDKRWAVSRPSVSGQNPDSGRRGRMTAAAQ